ncbi:hypothetical protein SH139x_003877 [Planctomycetaceae bacterium SH139]
MKTIQQDKKGWHQKFLVATANSVAALSVSDGKGSLGARRFRLPPSKRLSERGEGILPT